jgi:CelD/BcsL family acetyltransferase involved in cellulose biosynthesis
MRWSLHSVADFSACKEAWEAVHAAQGANPVLAWDFVEALLGTFASGHEVVAVATSAGDPVALGIFAPTRRGVWETFQPSQAPLGLWVQRPGLDLETAMASLMRRLPRFTLLAGLLQLDPDLVARPADSGRLRTQDYIRTARVSISTAFDSYWQQRGKNLQQNMRKQRSRLQKEGVQATLDVITAATDVAQAIADYGRLESAGWKATGGTAVHPDNAQGSFYRRALEQACARGAGCIYRYRFGDTPIAMDLCVRSGDTLVILKTAYDETLKGFSPAMLMRQESFERIFGDGRTRRIEFYGRVMEWHTRLTDEIRALYHVNVYRWSLLPAALGQWAKLTQKSSNDESAIGAHSPAPDNAS